MTTILEKLFVKHVELYCQKAVRQVDQNGDHLQMMGLIKAEQVLEHQLQCTIWVYPQLSVQ